MKKIIIVCGILVSANFSQAQVTKRIISSNHVYKKPKVVQKAKLSQSSVVPISNADNYAKNYYSTCPLAAYITLDEDCISPTGKDSHVHYTIRLYNSSGALVTTYTNNQDNEAWPPTPSYTGTSEQIININGNHKLGEFMSNPCKLTITFSNMEVSVNDPIKAKFTLRLRFSKPGNFNIVPAPESPFIIKWNEVSISKNNPEADLYFTYNVRNTKTSTSVPNNVFKAVNN